MSYKILSVGGSIIIPKTGFDVEFLKKFRLLIMSLVQDGEKFVLVVGGGATCRHYQETARQVAQLSDTDLDWLGISATHFNAELVRLFFGDLAYGEVLKNPTKKIRTRKPIIVAGGWRPGCSTDYDTVLWAKQFKAKDVINVSNINFVYDKDPNIYPEAKKIENITWAELRQIVGDKWSPGSNVPFDPSAAKLAQKLRLRVYFAKGTDLEALNKVILGQKTPGTVIA